MENNNISWQQIEDAVNNIVDRIKENQDTFEVIIGLSRGGLIPAVMLSQKLNIPLIPVVWQTRDGNIQWRHMVSIHNKSTTLVVDDLVDSGKTYSEIMSVAGNVKFAALFNKQYSISLDYWGTTLYDDPRWLCFPWETIT